MGLDPNYKQRFAQGMGFPPTSATLYVEVPKNGACWGRGNLQLLMKAGEITEPLIYRTVALMGAGTKGP